ncbi:MAG: DNA internalization-related competence protein ComEC/Rec2 [Clostridia bacterium]|nr:DNA internalization-related competence protein ComEC/Rec2 [Clostridia bacterium]
MTADVKPNMLVRFITRRPLALMAICYASGAALGCLCDLSAYIWGICLSLFAILFLIKKRAIYIFIALVFVASCTSAALLERSAAMPADVEATITGVVREINEQSHTRTVVTLTDAAMDGSDTGSGIRLYIYGGAQLSVADEIRLDAKTWLPRTRTSPGGFDFRKYLARHGVWLCATARSEVEITGNSGGTEVFLNSLREKIGARIDAVFTKNAVLARALILGDKSGLPDEVRTQFSVSGIAHLLAISGLHISCLAFAMAWLLRAMGMKRFVAFAVTAPVIAAYVVLIGAPSSALRALIMFCTMEAARVFGRKYDSLTSIAFAFFILIAPNPLMIIDTGFILSFTAVIGIIVFNPLLREVLKVSEKKGIAKAVINMACITVAAQLGTLPATSTMFGTLAPYSIITNILAIPLCTTGLPLIAAALILSGLFPQASGVIAAVPDFLLDIIGSIAEISSALPFARAYVPAWPMWAILVFIAILILVSPYSAIAGHVKRWLLLSVPALLIVCVIVVRATLPGGLTIVFSDAGAADSAIVRAEGKTYFIDVGKDGCSSIDYLSHTGQGVDGVFITHPHDDHMGGLEDLYAVRDIPVLYLPVGWEEHGGEDVVESARKRGTEIVYLSAGDEVELSENISLSVLNPESGEEYSDTNGLSLLMQISYGDGSALMTGDLPIKYEPDEFPKCQLLKAAHHGSSNGTSKAMLEGVSPEAVVITDSATLDSVSKKLIERIRAAGADIYHTGEMGMITATIHPDGTLHMESYL